MRKLLLAAVTCLCACGLSPEGFCLSESQVFCSKLFECNPQAAMFLGYSNEGDCEAKMRTQSNCQNLNDSNVCNGQGISHWDSNMAAQCLGDIRQASCSSNNFNPPSCNNVCK
jgi:hypothetical protein